VQPTSLKMRYVGPDYTILAESKHTRTHKDRGGGIRTHKITRRILSPLRLPFRHTPIRLSNMKKIGAVGIEPTLTESKSVDLPISRCPNSYDITFDKKHTRIRVADRI
jgi:hypothetical protein